MKLYWFLFFCFCVSQNLIAQDPVLSPRIANYKMHIELDADTKKLSGHTILRWKNTSNNPIEYLLFHLYYNAFKNSESTFFKEGSIPEFLSSDIDEVCGWSWSEITSIKDQEGNDLTPNIHHVQPDDQNTEDQTVLKVPLAYSLAPGEEIVLEFDWEAKIPKTMPRTGYNKEYYFFAQWFPKVGVYEPAGMRYSTEGQWNCHQYHANGEYYADFGNYDVSLRVPKGYTVASTGSLKEKTEDSNTETWRFTQNDVIDFTWSTSPHFVETTEWYKDVAIKFYTYPYKTDYTKRYMEIMKFCLQYMEEHVGPYPYKTISVIDPPVHGLFTGGMEYPTIISSLSLKFFPEGVKTLETLAAHEFIHQYFMQMVATHEMEEAWMDEGITTYYEGKILNAFFGEKCSTIDQFGITVGNKEWNRTEFFNSSAIDLAPNTLKSYEYTNGSYGPTAYNKTAIWLETLEGLVGAESMAEIMRTYFDRWKFKHPCRTDFLDVVDEIVLSNNKEQFPNGMQWYFDQVLFGTAVCDYSIEHIENEILEPKRGFLNTLDNCTEEEQEGSPFICSIFIRRLGDMKLPVEIEVSYEDGVKELYTWDGQNKSHELKIHSSQKIISATLDPEFKLPIDKNLINNSLSISSKSKATSTFLSEIRSGFQHVLEGIVSII